MFCNGYGDIVQKPFSVKNSPEGVEYLTEQVKRSCCHRRINPNHVLFGGEDVGSYAQNFAIALRSGGWLVAGVNPHDAKKQRANIQARKTWGSGLHSSRLKIFVKNEDRCLT